MKKAAAIASNPTAFQTLLFFLFTLFSSLLCHTLTRFFISFVQTLIGIFSFQKGTKKHLHVPLLEVHKVFFSLLFICRQPWFSRGFPIHFWWFYHTTSKSICPFPFSPFYFHFTCFIFILKIVINERCFYPWL